MKKVSRYVESLMKRRVESGPKLPHMDPVQGEPLTEPIVLPRVEISRPPKQRNMLLPSYTDELKPDNSIVKTPLPKSLYQRGLQWLHSFSTLIHVSPPQITFTPLVVKRIVIIGVHGWFPSKMLQRVVGEPTGTSAYFTDKMSNAAQEYFLKRHELLMDPACITCIPLQGEGLVEDRVESLYAQLMDPSKDWVASLSEADLVLVSAHSQGTPVAAMIVSKLLQDGILLPKHRIGIMAMAGIHHGPFPSLKSSVIVKYVESDPARQLFDFNDPYSTIARKYSVAINTVLNAGVRIIAIGSWYDQVVPLYSAVLHGVDHPNIYRALYIDAADYQPDFLSHLVVFALKLRNYGLSDHGLVVHLSDALAGNIYGLGTQGHSAIYEEPNTYILSIAWIMGQTSLWTQPHAFKYSDSQPDLVNDIQDKSWTLDFAAPTKSLNPFYLPWIMARILNDPLISSNPVLKSDLDRLLELFKHWDTGSNRVSKDIKYRLDPLKSKL